MRVEVGVGGGGWGRAAGIFEKNLSTSRKVFPLRLGSSGNSESRKNFFFSTKIQTALYSKWALTEHGHFLILALMRKHTQN